MRARFWPLTGDSPNLSSNNKENASHNVAKLAPLRLRMLPTNGRERDAQLQSTKCFESQRCFCRRSALGFPAIVRGQADKIKIGHLTPLTGFLGALGAYAQLGMRMAEEEINKAGGVMGRPLDIDVGRFR